jgi:hypothetical protein
LVLGTVLLRVRSWQAVVTRSSTTFPPRHKIGPADPSGRAEASRTDAATGGRMAGTGTGMSNIWSIPRTAVTACWSFGA